MLILERDGVFVLETENTHYVMAVDCEGGLCHEQWDKKCADIEDYKSTFTPWEKNSNHSARDLSKTEYLPYGGTCYRNSAFVVSYGDGCREALLTYKDFEVTFEDEDTFLLEIILEDKPTVQAGFSTRICLATDEQVEACNQYTAGYYTFDKGNYPATPLE